MKILEIKIIVSKEKEKKKINKSYLNFQVQANSSPGGKSNKKKELVSKRKQ